MCVGHHIRIGVIPTLNGEVNNEKFQRTMKPGRWEHRMMHVVNHAHGVW